MSGPTGGEDIGPRGAERSPHPVSDESIRARKSALRRRICAAREALDDVALTAAAAQVRRELRDLGRRMALIAAYVPVRPEPGCVDLLDDWRAQGARVLLPVATAHVPDLDWRSYDGRLVAGPYGLRQPHPESPRVPLQAAELVVVPALAVDRAGRRLGRGGGFYDRALAPLPAAVTVLALLHAGELLDEVPAEPHDRPVTGVLTPDNGWVTLPAHRVDGMPDSGAGWS